MRKTTTCDKMSNSWLQLAKHVTATVQIHKYRYRILVHVTLTTHNAIVTYTDIVPQAQAWDTVKQIERSASGKFKYFGYKNQSGLSHPVE